MDEKECIQMIKKKVKEIIKSTNRLEILSTKDQFKDRVSLIPDFVMNVQTRGKRQYPLLFEVISIGQPRYIRMAANELQFMVSKEERSYGILGAPYLSEKSILICRENGIGFIDIAGNCLLDFDNIYINISGKSNPYPSTRPLKSLFARKSTRVLRVLLSNPGKKWSVKELSQEANISLGQTSNIKQKLLDYEFIEESQKKKFSVINPEMILRKWGENYEYKQNRITNFYSSDEVEDIEKKLVSYCEAKKISYAFTLTSGASLVTPLPLNGRFYAYVVGSIERIARSLGWKEVNSGANVLILEPYDKFVFYGLQDIMGTKVVSDIQLYLDLQSFKPRGEEAARYLLEKRLRLQW